MHLHESSCLKHIFNFTFLWLKSEDGYAKFLTKGDNNQVDDRGLYSPGQIWLERKDIIGRAKGFMPYVGYVTILMNDYPQLKVSEAVPFHV